MKLTATIPVHGDTTYDIIADGDGCQLNLNFDGLCRTRLKLTVDGSAAALRAIDHDSGQDIIAIRISPDGYALPAIVNVFTDEIKNGEHRYTLIVSHPQKPIGAFAQDWQAALALAKHNSPDEWSCDDIHAVLKESGWLVQQPGSVEVKY